MLRAPITWSRSRIGKAWTETTRSPGQRARTPATASPPGQVGLGDLRAGAVAVEARALLVLDLEELEDPRALVGGAHVVQATVEVREHQARRSRTGHLRRMASDAVQEVDDVEVGHQGVGHLDEDVRQPFDVDHGPSSLCSG